MLRRLFHHPLGLFLLVLVFQLAGTVPTGNKPVAVVGEHPLSSAPEPSVLVRRAVKAGLAAKALAPVAKAAPASAAKLELDTPNLKNSLNANTGAKNDKILSQEAKPEKAAPSTSQTKKDAALMKKPDSQLSRGPEIPSRPKSNAAAQSKPEHAAAAEKLKGTSAFKKIPSLAESPAAKPLRGPTKTLTPQLKPPFPFDPKLAIKGNEKAPASPEILASKKPTSEIKGSQGTKGTARIRPGTPSYKSGEASTFKQNKQGSTSLNLPAFKEKTPGENRISTSKNKPPAGTEENKSSPKLANAKAGNSRIQGPQSPSKGTKAAVNSKQLNNPKENKLGHSPEVGSKATYLNGKPQVHQLKATKDKEIPTTKQQNTETQQQALRPTKNAWGITDQKQNAKPATPLDKEEYPTPKEAADKVTAQKAAKHEAQQKAAAKKTSAASSALGSRKCRRFIYTNRFGKRAITDYCENVKNTDQLLPEVGAGPLAAANQGRYESYSWTGRTGPNWSNADTDAFLKKQANIFRQEHFGQQGDLTATHRKNVLPALNGDAPGTNSDGILNLHTSQKKISPPNNGDTPTMDQFTSNLMTTQGVTPPTEGSHGEIGSIAAQNDENVRAGRPAMTAQEVKQLTVASINTKGQVGQENVPQRACKNCLKLVSKGKDLYKNAPPVGQAREENPWLVPDTRGNTPGSSDPEEPEAVSGGSADEESDHWSAGNDSGSGSGTGGAGQSSPPQGSSDIAMADP